ncbi:baculovirus F protein domain-containing protein [Phthorimaea operculella]|nr:baculovirus F protein domain-containing protein [Phthorimaea operculella]
MPYEAIILQLEHELTEMQQYNHVLRNPNKRHKRGLVNGVGNLASYLFGVLDDKFAEQYKQDIEQISQNENHLQNLIKNQTLIIESEYNVIRRNEEIMNKQFIHMNRQMKGLYQEVNNVKSDTLLYLTSSTLSAYVVLSNLRRMQQSLIDVITDIYHGHIDTHLFPPEELEAQLNIITREIQDDLTLPLEPSNIKGLYRLMRVFARVYEDYLIMEVRIPLITTEKYELDKVITLQKSESENNYHVKPTYQYIAFNLKKDQVLFFTESDLQLCIHASPEKILCPIDKPTFDIRAGQSICNIKINNQITSPCTLEQSKCEEKWIKLHRANDWIFQCCQQCTVRIFSARATELKTLSGNGIISLCKGCTLKGEAFQIHSYKQFKSHVNHHIEDVELPQLSIVNDLINTSMTTRDVFAAEDHSIMLNQLKTQIEELKQQSTQTLSVHDVHQYSVLYSLVGGAILTGLVLIIMWIRRRKRHQVEMVSGIELSHLENVPIPRPRAINKSVSTPDINSIKFNIPLRESE